MSPHDKGQLNSHHEVCLQGPRKIQWVAKLLHASGPPPHVLAAPVLAVQQLAEPSTTTEALGATWALFLRKVSSVPTQVMLWTVCTSLMTAAGRAPASATQRGLDQQRPSGEMVGAGSRQGCCLQCPGWQLALLWLGCWDVSRSPTAGCHADTQPGATGMPGEGRYRARSFAGTCVHGHFQDRAWTVGESGKLFKCSQPKRLCWKSCAAGPADQREDNPGFRKEEDRSEVAVGPIWVRQ